MRIADQNEVPTRLKGKYRGMLYCWILGTGSLITWNCLVNIGDYYYKLFPKYHPERVITLCYLPVAIIAMVILASYESKVNTRKRNISGLLIFLISTLALLVLDLGTKGRGGIRLFVVICVLSSSFGLADSLYRGGMIGDLSFMCPEFLQSFLAGMAASGALVCGLRLFTKGVFEKYPNGLHKGVILFLAIAIGLEFVCLLLYAFFFPKLPIVTYYRSKASSEGSKTVLADLEAGGVPKDQINEIEHQRLSVKQLLYRNLDYTAEVFLTFLLSLSIFPGFLYENTGAHKLGSWYALVLVTVYNACDFLGRYIPLVEILRVKSRRGLMIAVVLRFLLIPAFYYTAKYGDQGWMILLTSILGGTNGYFIVCVYTDAPKGYKGPEQNAIGNVLAGAAFAGLFTGASLDWLWLIGSKNAF